MTVIEADRPDLPTHGRMLRAQARRHADRVFAVIDDDSVTYGRFVEQAEALARSLIARGVRRGEHIGILMPNCLEFLQVYYAAQLAGVVATPINARYKSSELAHVVGFSDIRILFTTDRIEAHVDFAELLLEALPSLAAAARPGALNPEEAPRLDSVVMFGDTRRPAFESADAFLAAGRDLDQDELNLRVEEGGADDIALMLFTSGTTARPKACRISHRNLFQTWVIAYPQVVSLEAGQAIWCPLPCFHIGGVGLALSALSRGATFLSATHHRPEAALTFLERHRPAHLYPGFFTLLLPMLRDPAYDRDRFGFIRTVWMVAPYETHLQVRELLPQGVIAHQNFGMTEGAGMVTVTRPDMPDAVRLQANGRALDGCEVRIARLEDDTPLPAGEEGEIQFRGPDAFHSYYKDEAASRAARAPGGWVKTGDCGRMDADGLLYFRGRLKDMLKVGGENVAAAEIEAYLGRHPAVDLAQVVGRPDARYGEIPVAFVRLREGFTARPEELIAFCTGKLASFKVPREVIFVDQWPMSATKIQKFRLRELLAEAHSGQTGLPR